jgi:hypothetical protein
MDICRDNDIEEHMKINNENMTQEIDIEIYKQPVKLLKNSYDRLEKVSMFWNYSLHRREKIYLSESECHIYKILPNSQK